MDDHILTLPTKYTAESLAKCHSQEQCPLFSKIPGELRNRIFEFACAPSEDPDHRYEPTEYYYRPGYHAKPKYETGLLRTCRRIWIETHSLPIASAVPSFWFKDPGRAPVWSRTVPSTTPSRDSHENSNVEVGEDDDDDEADEDHDEDDDYDDDYSYNGDGGGWWGYEQHEENRLKDFLQRLTPQNRADLQCLRIFAQMFWLEGGNLASLAAAQHNAVKPPFRSTTVWPREVIVTIRHTDWWNWESDQDLYLRHGWIGEFLEHEDLEGMQVFRLELETLKVAHKETRDWSTGGWRSADPGRKVAQLQQIIHDIKSEHGVVEHWKMKPDSGKEAMTWTRPGNIDGDHVEPQSALTQLDYVVYDLTWTRMSGDGRAVKQDPSPSDHLE